MCNGTKCIIARNLIHKVDEEILSKWLFFPQNDEFIAFKFLRESILYWPGLGKVSGQDLQFKHW